MALTKEEILTRMLDRVENKFDKREGSVIYDALAPVAYEIEQVLLDYENKLKNTFAGTAERDGLVQRCIEAGVLPFEATYAIRRMVTTPKTLDIQIGERFRCDDLNFIVIEKIEDGLYNVQCEEKGSKGNYGTGNLIPIDHVAKLETAKLIDDVVIYGEDEEETEALRERYFATLPTMTLDGNVAQYSKWCREFGGIGNYKIFPTWNGINTVKVSILSSENTPASDELIAEFQEFLDPNSEGLGEGKAPIGAMVTVTTAKGVNIDVTAQLTLKSGFIEPLNLREKILEYLKGINYNRNFVSVIAISSIIQNCDGVDVVIDTQLNGGKENIPLTIEEVAVLNNLNIEVVE